jgi:organic hydroperoxide reductase OsmC/OhrA
MLFFLSFAASDGFVVASYDDCAIGVMGKTAEGREWVAEVTLRPRLVFEGENRPTAAEVDGLHHRSHEACYIANSVKTNILIDGHAEGLRQGNIGRRDGVRPPISGGKAHQPNTASDG